MRVFLGAFGDPGHAFPMLALGRSLTARGHEVTFETWARWRGHVEAEGIRFAAAPEYPVFPTRERPLSPYEAVVKATAGTRKLVRNLVPDVVVHDILTLAPAMAAELEGIPFATLIPHVHPSTGPGLPPYALGARPPRTRLGRAIWRALESPVHRGLRRGKAELNETRRRLGLPAVSRLHGGISAELCIVGTFPQLEYRQVWPAGVHLVGPLLWEPPFEDVPAPAGSEPLVLVAPSTAQDTGQRLLRCALAGLAGEPVRLLASTNRRPLAETAVPPASAAALVVPPNARLVDWLSYSRTMPACSLVITHGGHGTIARSLASGCPMVAVPHSGDMGENAARIDWARVGVRLPWRLLTPTTLRLAVRRALADQRLAARAAELAAWAAANDGASRAAELIEKLAVSRPGEPARTR